MKEKIILHEKHLKERKIILLINFIFAPTLFLIASSQISKNHAILIIHGSSFLQGKDSLQYDCLQFFKINSLMAETIKKQIFQNKIFINKLLSLVIIDSF